MEAMSLKNGKIGSTHGKHHEVCPLERSGRLDGRLRKLIHSPKRHLGKYIREGMTVLDLGCGPGFFSVALADMAGPSGKVIAADLQDGMLEKLEAKIRGTDIEKRIKLHKTGKDSIGVKGPVDFVLAFYILHELPDQKNALEEIKSILRPGGILYVSEPTFRVGKQEFEGTMQKIQSAGFTIMERPRVLLSRTAVFRK